ncbi:MAG: DUF3465 domain-containing protein, partial [Armatimonadetes bacterium]|nr:DUF3465 domain-containing protein [Armatimonadota bacterium]
KIFPDDLNGNKHQLFYLRTLSGYLVKVAHNVSLATRIPNLKEGLFLTLKGEFKDRDSLKDKSYPVFKFNEDPAIIGLIHYTHKSTNPNFKEDGGIIILEKGPYYHQIMR